MRDPLARRSVLSAGRRAWRLGPRHAAHLAALGVALAATLGAATRLATGPGATPVGPVAEGALSAAPAMPVAADELAFQPLAPAPAPASDAALAPPADGQPAPAGPAADADPAPPVRTHRVAPGESLAQLAARYGLRVETLLWANDLADPALLRPGDELRVPAADGALYTLAPGDTLRGVAERAGVSLAELLAANPLTDPDRVPVGAEVLVPGAAPAVFAPPRAPAATEALDGVQTAASVGAVAPSPPPKPAPVTYVVQPGDTLATLGSKFGVDLETLLAANEIADPNTVRVGTTLRVLPVSGVEHVVQPGERLADIAARYQTVLGLILDFNALEDPDLVRPGDRLVIPGGRRLAAAAPTLMADAAPAAGQPAAPQPKPKPAVATSAPPPAAAPAPQKPAPAPASGALGQRIVAEALKYNGYRYTWGGSSPATGFDCSGLVWYVHQQVGAPISRGLWGQYNAGAKVARGDLQPGDIVFFQNTYMPGLSHNGIYIGNGQFINAVDESTGVVISRLDNPYWVERWFGATRVGG